jgi:hypothetical protein
MPWVRFDDQFPWHLKVSRLSDAAFRLHTSAVCWSSRHLTDGQIPHDGLRDVAPRVRQPMKAADELVSVGLWRTEEAGWIIHDYLDYQPSAAEVRAKRKAATERKRQSRITSQQESQRDGPCDSHEPSHEPSHAESHAPSPRAYAHAPAPVPSLSPSSSTDLGPSTHQPDADEPPSAEDRLVAEIRLRRPDWKPWLIRGALDRVLAKPGVSPGRASDALRAVAADPDTRQPIRVLENGWWWDESDTRRIDALNRFQEAS